MDDNMPFVYYIYAKECNRIKIGKSVNVEHRLGELEKHSPVRLFLLAVEPGGYERESEMHIRFKEYRRKGEWFEASGELKEYIDTIKMINWDLKMNVDEISILLFLKNHKVTPELPVLSKTNHIYTFILIDKMQKQGLLNRFVKVKELCDVDSRKKKPKFDNLEIDEYYYSITSEGTDKINMYLKDSDLNMIEPFKGNDKRETYYTTRK